MLRDAPTAVEKGSEDKTQNEEHSVWNATMGIRAIELQYIPVALKAVIAD